MSRSSGRRFSTRLPLIFLTCYTPFKAKMKPDIEKLRKQHMHNPPEELIFEDIRCMREDALLDMDYFLNENDLLDDETGVEGFYIF